MRRKLKDVWLLLKSKHYIVLTSDSMGELDWALQTLKDGHAKDKKERGEHDSIRIKEKS